MDDFPRHTSVTPSGLSSVRRGRGPMRDGGWPFAFEEIVFVPVNHRSSNTLSIFL